MKDTLDQYTTNRNHGDEKFQAFVKEEAARLQNALVAETQVRLVDIDDLVGYSTRLFANQTREREDDEILEALNRYTTKLQDSLKVINSPDA